MSKVILVVRDGWGYRKDSEKNFIKLSNTPRTDEFEKKFPTIHLGASGKWVGLPDGFMGNSEVGHMTLGAGKVLKQSLLRINESIEDGSYLIDKNILSLIQKVKRNKGDLHLIILIQRAGVHSYLDHLFATLNYALKEGLRGGRVKLHLITDGRDEDVKAGIKFLDEIVDFIQEKNVGEIVTLSGRYYAMDRNQNWERTEKYYNALIDGVGEIFECPFVSLEEFYKKNITDEFIPPLVKKGYQGVSEKDGIFFLNFRKDRARQITKAIIEPDFISFERKKVLNNLNFLSMTRYYKEQSSPVVFEDLKVENVLGEILEKNQKMDLRIAETEKFAHVTFFFDGGVKRNFKTKTEIIVKSPDVPTYDLKPEMSAREITNWAMSEIQSNEPDFILINYANTDMVGHTGVFEAIQKAVETVDEEVGRLVDFASPKGYQIILTGDHGNVEDKREKTRTTHTTNTVPTTFIFNQDNLSKIDLEKIKGLADLKGAILKVLGIKE